MSSEECKETSNSAYIGLGLTGLANTGNSCYLNSCMQILSHTYELNDMFKKKQYQKRLNRIADSALLLEWDKLREMMWSSNCTIAPWGFIKAVQKVSTLKNIELFSGHAQNDIQEYLLFVIDCFHNALAREVDMEVSGIVKNGTDKLAQTCYSMMKTMYGKEYSEMLNIFYGIHVSEITSMTTEESLSLRPEPFSVLSLSLPDKNNISLMECVDLYCKREKMEGDNAWLNDKTNKKEDVNRGIIFWSLPNILIIDLKRWGGTGRKVNSMVSAPIKDADFSTYVRGYNSKSYIYDLYGVCNHSGGSLGGHYTAYVKNANDKWYEFDDTSVTEIKEENVITTRSYCFFYRKKK